MTTAPQPSVAPHHASNNPLLLAAAWIVVGVPLAWGVYNTVKTSAKLFQASPAPTASAPADHATTPTTLEQKANP